MTIAIQVIPLGQIQPSPNNPRTFTKNDPDLVGLADSIRQQGVLEPILVRPIETKKAGAPPFEIVAGERRWRAATLAGLDTIPALVREGLSADAALELTITENLQRKDLHALDEAKGYQGLLRIPGFDVAKIAARVGRSVKYVYDRVKLLALTKELQDLFRADKITAGHAILLARLTKDDQARALRDGVFTSESLLWDPRDDERQGDDGMVEDDEPQKPVSVRELQAWIDENVKFQPADVDAMLFPETAATLQVTVEAKEKIVQITHDYHVQPEAKDGSRIFGPRSWKRADGVGKTCDSAVTGVIVVGPGRGEAFKVCTNKKGCKVHWAQEQRETARLAKARSTSGVDSDAYKEQEAKRKAEQERQEARRARWKKAAPAILEAMAEKVKKASTSTSGELARLLLQAVTPSYRDPGSPKPTDFLPLGRSADDLVQHAVFVLLVRRVMDWRAPEDFPKVAKAFGVDTGKILDDAAPVEKAQTSAKPAAKKKATPKKKAKAA